MGTQLAREGRNDGHAVDIPALGIEGVVHALTITSAAQRTGKIAANTTVIEIGCNTDFRIAVGGSGVTADQTSTLRLAGVYFQKVAPGQYVSIVKNTGALDGVATVTECS